MRKSTPVVSSGEAASYDSDSKQTIPGPVKHLAEIEEAVALAASLFSATSFFVCCAFFSHFVLGRRHSRRDSSKIVARRDVLLIRRKQRSERVRDCGGHLITDDDNRKFRASLWFDKLLRPRKLFVDNEAESACPCSCAKSNSCSVIEMEEPAGT
jgi:hypothetical protein